MIVAASFDINDPEQWYNRAFQYGDGLFETMRFTGDEIPLLPFHKDRLSNGLSRLKLKEVDWQEIEINFKKKWAKQGLTKGVYKLSVFRAGNERGYQSQTQATDWLLAMYPLNDEVSPRFLKLGLSNFRLSIQPELAGLKHLNRLEQVLIARQLSNQSVYDDLMVLDMAGHLVETCSQNIVCIQDNQLITPNLEQAGVAGVALDWLKSNFAVKVATLTPNDIESFDALMVCNAVRGFRMVANVSFDNHLYSFVTSHPVHDKISSQWQMIFNP